MRFIRLYFLTLNIIDMKKAMILFVLMIGISRISFGQTWQQTWSDMSKEEKMMKLLGKLCGTLDGLGETWLKMKN